MKYPSLLLKGYVGTFALLGFYQGFNADYTMRYNKKIETIKYELLTDKLFSKFFRGVVNSFFYTTFGHGIAVYKLLGRVEIFLTKKNPYDHKDFYIEFFDYTTLKPEEVKSVSNK